MSQLKSYFSDETRVFIEENYQTHNLNLFSQSSYAEKPSKLGEFRLVKGKLIFVLEKEADISIVNEVSELKEIKVTKADDDIPF